jgi:WD40 repeat protein
MGRRLGALTFLLAACGGPLAFERVAARGVLGYGVVAAGARVVSVELDGEFRLVIRGGRELRAALGPPDWDFVALDARGDIAVVAGLDGTVRLHDLGTGAEIRRWRLEAAATAAALSADGRFLATGSAAGVLCLRRLPEGALLQCVVAHAGRIGALAFSGERLASGGADGVALIWSVPALRRLARDEGAAPVNGVAFSPGGALATARGQTIATVWVDDHRRVTAEADRTLRLRDGEGRERGRLGGFSGAIRALAPAPGGIWVASFCAPDDRGPAISFVKVED